MITDWNVLHVQTIMIVCKTTGTWWQILQQLQVWMSTGNHSNKIPSWAINMTTGDKATKLLVIQSWWGVITLLQNLLKSDCKKNCTLIFSFCTFLKAFHHSQKPETWRVMHDFVCEPFRNLCFSRVYLLNFLPIATNALTGSFACRVHNLREVNGVILQIFGRRSWHADDVVQTPQVAFQFFFFFFFLRNSDSDLAGRTAYNCHIDTIVHSLISGPQTFSDFFSIMRFCGETVLCI